MSLLPDLGEGWCDITGKLRNPRIPGGGEPATCAVGRLIAGHVERCLFPQLAGVPGQVNWDHVNWGPCESGDVRRRRRSLAD